MRLMVLAACFIITSGASAQQKKSPKLPPGIILHRDLEYVKDGHERHRLDIYLPEKPEKADTPLPVIVWVHGGAWQAGSKESMWPALPFVTKGYAVAAINYRLSQHALFPAQIEDCKAAIRWLRANAKKYHLDPNHVAAWGSSAGGHLVALLGTAGDVKELEGAGGNLDQSSRVQAVVNWYGPTDFTKMGGWHDGPMSPEAKLIGGPVQQHKDKAARANPIIYVTEDDPPFLIMHGDKDPTVPFNQSELLHAALKKADVEVIFQPVKGAGHGGKEFGSPESRRLIEEFLDKHLRKKNSARSPRQVAEELAAVYGHKLDSWPTSWDTGCTTTSFKASPWAASPRLSAFSCCRGCSSGHRRRSAWKARAIRRGCRW